MPGLIDHLVHKREKRLIVSLGWTKDRDFHCLMAAARIGGLIVRTACPKTSYG